MPRPTTRRVPLEVAVFSGRSALEAQRLGASRVELNAPGSYAAGGLTPDVAVLASIRPQLTIPVHVMIRPRGPPAVRADGGLQEPDFVYSATELARMTAAIGRFKAAGLMNPFRGDRFVFGAVREASVDDDDAEDGGLLRGGRDGKQIEIDETACRTLIQAAKPFGCVFHRAFDAMAAGTRGAEAAEVLIRLGFECVLTAGGTNGSCCERTNVDNIDHLCHRVNGRLQVIVGGGLRRYNASRAADVLAVYADYEESDSSCVWFHTAAVRRADDGSPTEELDVHELQELLIRFQQREPA
ncbi:hypothetical protein HIM_00361 [Hirsutella minnesotensis 3608]|nr:hypothetical protein HIM_00361 [Hirsutella minnesotensis 3608]